VIKKLRKSLKVGSVLFFALSMLVLFGCSSSTINEPASETIHVSVTDEMISEFFEGELPEEIFESSDEDDEPERLTIQPFPEYRELLSENSHPFAVALVEFFEEIPPEDYPGDNLFFGENAVISDTSAFLIDLDGNGTIGVAAYKAFGEGDFHRIFYMFDGELRWHGGGGLWFYLNEIYESPLIHLSGGEGAGIYYDFFTFTPDGLVSTTALWDINGDYYYYPTVSNDDVRRVSEEEFAVLLNNYGFSGSRLIPFVRRPHYIESYGYARNNSLDPSRPCDTFEILAMTIQP